MRILFPGVSLFAIFLIACNNESKVSTAEPAPGPYWDAPGVRATNHAMPAVMEVAPTATFAVSASRPGTSVAAFEGAARSGETMLIQQGRATIEVDALEESMGRVRTLADELEGTVGNIQILAGEARWRQAIMEIRLPARRFDELIERLRSLGKIETLDLTTQDVTEEYTDLESRLANTKRLEDRLLRLLENRTAKLEEVLQVERELARIRSEIERYEGRIRFLRSRIDTSRITVTLKEPIPITPRPSPNQNIIAKAFEDAWRNFVTTIARMVAWLGIALPVVLVITIAAVTWRALRHWTRK